MSKKENKFKSVNVAAPEDKRLDIWKNRIKVGRQVHKKNFADTAKRLRDFYKGEQYPRIAESKDRIVVNYTYAILKSIVPQIYFQDPYFFLNANSEQYYDRRFIAEIALNAAWRKMKTKKQMRRIILDMLVYGFGVGKLGYYTDTVNADNLETNLEYSYLINDEYPFFIRQSPMDMVFDPDAKHPDDLRWIGARYFVPLEDLKSNAMGYDNVEDIKGDHVLDRETLNGLKLAKGEEEDDLKRVEIYEIQDLVENKFLTICLDHDKFLKDVDNEYPIEGSVWKLLYSNEIPDEFFPLSEVASLEKLNKEYNETVSQLLNHRRKAQRKIIAEEGVFLTDEDKEAFLNSDDMAFSEVHPGASDKLQVFNASMVDANAYAVRDSILFDMNNISRVGFNQRGVESDTEKTATESSIIEKNANLGNSERLDVISDYTEEVARGTLAILQKFSTKEQEVYLEKKDAFVKWKNTDIAGDYSVKVEAGSMTKRNSDLDRNRAYEFFTAVVNLTEPNPQTGREEYIVDRKMLARKLAEKYALSDEDIALILKEEEKPPKVITPEEDRAEQQRQQLLAQSQAQPQLSPEDLALLMSTMGGQGMPPGGMPGQGNPGMGGMGL